MGLLHRDVATALADDDGQFHFIVEAVGQRAMAQHRTPVPHQSRAWFGEKLDGLGKRIGRAAIGQIAFDDVLAVVAPHVEDIAARGCHRRQHCDPLQRQESCGVAAHKGLFGDLYGLPRLHQGRGIAGDEFVHRLQCRLHRPSGSQVEDTGITDQGTETRALGVGEIEELHADFLLRDISEVACCAFSCSTAT